MGQKSVPVKELAEQVVREIRRAIRRQLSDGGGRHRVLLRIFRNVSYFTLLHRFRNLFCREW
jgi:hypothetical protein